jgi:hypothetical protein
MIRTILIALILAVGIVVMPPALVFGYVTLAVAVPPLASFWAQAVILPTLIFVSWWGALSALYWVSNNVEY